MLLTAFAVLTLVRRWHVLKTRSAQAWWFSVRLEVSPPKGATVRWSWSPSSAEEHQQVQGTKSNSRPHHQIYFRVSCSQHPSSPKSHKAGISTGLALFHRLTIGRASW